MIRLADLSPREGWLCYEPTAEQPFDRRAAGHLFRRAGFAATFSELDQATARSPEVTIQKLLAGEAEHAAFAEGMQQFATSVLGRNESTAVASWWLYRMRHTPAPLLEKTTLFWHGHFATSAAKVNDAKLMLQQNNSLRQQALGDFPTMVKSIGRDPAMLLYLDSATNRKTRPNENFAREVLELFCLGPGNYTEHDIQQLARCYTGWEIQNNTFKFNSYQHDTGSKSIFGRSGNFDGDTALPIILAQPAAARFLCTKLVRFFVADEQFVAPEWIEPLAVQLQESQFKIQPVLATILSSRVFFSPAARGAKVRSPVEMTIGFLRAFDAGANLQTLVESLRGLGQLPLFPPNVKGWNGGREWINAATIVARANVMRQLIEGASGRFGGTSLVDWLEHHDLKSGKEIVAGLCDLLLPIAPPAAVREQLVAQFDSTKDRAAATQRALHQLCTLPEYQLA
ncbi:DUF1800 family protein [Anatilimnocola sp. NA78]|uniref:DUF1800 domain-containing protein n=1 Tax=Anatilimnocola sp. NA78 TaxID=3415683 RepID=UPI003CE478E0